MGAVSAQGAQFWRGDFVLLSPEFGGAVGEVWFHVSCDDGAPQTVLVLHPRGAVCAKRRWARYMLQADAAPLLVDTRCLQCACIFRRSSDGNTLTLLVPYVHRAWL